MGVWGTSILSNDLAGDVCDTYQKSLEKGLSDEDAYKKTYDECFADLEEDEFPFFWYALALKQWKCGRLMPEVKKTALDLISRKAGADLFEKSDRKKWEANLLKLEEQLNSPMPKRKVFGIPKPFKHNPWNIGDIYAYKMHTDIAYKYGCMDKYLVFQKIADCNADGEHSVVQFFDGIFETVPDEDDLRSVRIIPMTPLLEMKSSSEQAEWFRDCLKFNLNSPLEYYKERDYPKKYLTFIGNGLFERIPASPHIAKWRWMSLDSKTFEQCVPFYIQEWKEVDYKQYL